MADLRLSFAMTPYDRIMPLINGEVKPDGVILDYMGMPGGIPRVFYEQIKFQRYDLSEMSMSSFLRMRSIGLPYRILPVFHNRNFSYAYIHIRKGSGIRQGHPEDLKGKRVLCLAAGGGQAAPAFALLGAEVVSQDISETQLERDREAAKHYGVSIETHQGDMRDFSRFEDDSFDVVHHGHSMIFIPDPRPVFSS